MTETLERPKFWSSFFSAMAERAEKGTLWRMFAGFTICVGVSVAVSYFMPAEFWNDDRWDVAATVYTGVLTLNGLILALSWSAFSRIYEMVSAPKFSAFLRRHALLNKYIVTVSFIHALQLFAVVASAIGLVAVLIDVVYVTIDRAVLGVTVFASVYAIYHAAMAVGVMHDLVWQKSAFDGHQEASGGTVVPMGGRNDS